MGDAHDAEDALQDALLAIHRNAGSFRGDSQVTTWMHRIVVNACLDRLRRKKNRPSVPLISSDGEYEREVADPIDISDLTTVRLDLVRALSALPEEQRVAIVLVDLEGLSIEAAAEALGCPTGTVKSRCSRGRAALARELNARGNSDYGRNVRPSGEPGSGEPGSSKAGS